MDLPEFIGLDIGSSSIRLARVQYTGGKAQVMKLAQTLFDKQVQSMNDPATQQYIAQKIRELLNSEKIHYNKVVAALPEAMIFSKIASVPDLREEQLEQMLFYELKNHIPVNPAEVQKDYIVLGPDPINPKMIKILLIAAPKALVEVYKLIAKEAKIDLIALETETVALARLVSATEESHGPMLIVDFGHKGVDLCLVHASKIYYSQSIGTGSESLTKALMVDLGITYQQAEQYKQKVGLNEKEQDGKIFRSLTPIMHIITNEINKLINYFKSNLPGHFPKSILLMGEGSRLPVLDQYLTKSVGIPCVRFDGVIKLPLSAEVKSQFSVTGATGYSVAVGLAMKQE